MEVMTHQWQPIAYTLRMMHWHAKLGLLLIVLGVLILFIKAWPDAEALERQQATLLKLQQQKTPVAASKTVPSPEQRFYGLLPTQSEVNQKIAEILATAREHDLQIEKAEYSQPSANSHLHKYLVRLPVSGHYTKIRQFINQVLNQQPYLALSEINLKRDDISNEQISSQILFTLYVK